MRVSSLWSQEKRISSLEVHQVRGKEKNLTPCGTGRWWAWLVIVVFNLFFHYLIGLIRYYKRRGYRDWLINGVGN